MHTVIALILAASLQQAAAPQRAADDPADYVKQARRLVASGSHDEALALYQKAIEAQPSSFEAHLGAGLVLDLKLQFADARTQLSKALELAPDEAKPQVMNALAVSYAFEGNAKEAAAFYQKVFDGQVAESNFVAAAGTANALGRVYLETGDVANARRWYQTGYESARRQADVSADQLALWEFRWVHAQARISARAGQVDDSRKQVSAARALLDRTPALKDETRSWHYLAGYVELYARNYATAIELLQAADQEDPFVLSLLARAYEGAGNPDSARNTWALVLKANGHSLQNAFARPMAMQKTR
jgi:tetratricopeptide (TPR) repeat protein